MHFGTGDFTSDVHTYVVSSESLTHGSRTILSLTLPAERDSLLLCEELDLKPWPFCADIDEDIAGNSGTINSSDNETEYKAEENDSEVENNDNNADDNASNSSDLNLHGVV